MYFFGSMKQNYYFFNPFGGNNFFLFTIFNFSNFFFAQIVSILNNTSMLLTFYTWEKYRVNLWWPYRRKLRVAWLALKKLNSHFVGHIKHQRGDGNKDQTHPEYSWTEHHVRLERAHRQTHEKEHQTESETDF